jgi:hypothetical protein
VLEDVAVLLVGTDGLPAATIRVVAESAADAATAPAPEVRVVADRVLKPVPTTDVVIVAAALKSAVATGRPTAENPLVADITDPVDTLKLATMDAFALRLAWICDALAVSVAVALSSAGAAVNTVENV